MVEINWRGEGKWWISLGPKAQVLSPKIQDSCTSRAKGKPKILKERSRTGVNICISGSPSNSKWITFRSQWENNLLSVPKTFSMRRSRAISAQPNFFNSCRGSCFRWKARTILRVRTLSIRYVAVDWGSQCIVIDENPRRITIGEDLRCVAESRCNPHELGFPLCSLVNTLEPMILCFFRMQVECVMIQWICRWDECSSGYAKD